MIWMFDTDIFFYFINRKPGFEQVARRVSGRSPGELRLSVITSGELRFGVENGKFRAENRRAP
jgi:predicted nucleic acid-binding protein